MFWVSLVFIHAGCGGAATPVKKLRMVHLLLVPVTPPSGEGLGVRGRVGIELLRLLVLEGVFSGPIHLLLTSGSS